MDYKDYQASKSDFWFRAKKDLLSVLMHKVLDLHDSCHGERVEPSRIVLRKSFDKLRMTNKGRLKILNVGSGTGDDLEVLHRFGDITVTDVDPIVLSLVPKELCVETTVADICSLPYADASFDVVVSLDVFEHIQDDVKALSEVYRVLKPGGVLVFGVPAFQFLWSARDVALEHKRRYSRPMLTMLFHQFSSMYINHWNAALFPLVAIQRLVMRNAKPHVESVRLPKTLNTILYQIMKFDTFCVAHHIPLPFGISLVGWCKK